MSPNLTPFLFLSAGMSQSCQRLVAYWCFRVFYVFSEIWQPLTQCWFQSASFWRGLRFCTCAVPAASALQRPPSNENVSVGWIKACCSTNNSWWIHKTKKKKKERGGKKKKEEEALPPTTLCLCYKKSKKRGWPPEPKVLTLNQIPLDLNWQAGPSFRLLYHILERCLYVPQDTQHGKSGYFTPIAY